MHGDNKLGENFKCPNTCIIGIPGGRRGGRKKIFEEIMDKKFLNLRKTISLQVEEAQ